MEILVSFEVVVLVKGAGWLLENDCLVNVEFCVVNVRENDPWLAVNVNVLKSVLG